MSDVQRFNNEVQRAGKDGFDAVVSSFGEANKGFQAIAAEITAYSKKSFEDGTRAFEQLLGAKSFEQVIEIQSQYARMAYEAYVAELSKLGEMYAGPDAQRLQAGRASRCQGWRTEFDFEAPKVRRKT